MRVEKRSRSKILSFVSKAAQCIIQKRTHKNSFLCFARQLNVLGVRSVSATYAKVLAVKVTENSVFLEVEEEVEEGVWDNYEIEYDSNMKP
ncbi:uncharacterized protein VTP21DRAFT_7955 [Calcarisporiella thermophila]|uniref:uncharacterized protein n=1 Tax=Calcarisporiella thermophila TaxID=911321 RepID=UPI0037426CBA